METATSEVKLSRRRRKNVEVGACLIERESPQTDSMVNIRIETELPSNSELRQTSVRRKKKKKCHHQNLESCSVINTADLSLEVPVSICSKNESETNQIAARMNETKCHTSSVAESSVEELKTSSFDCDKHSPRKNKEKRKHKHNAAENNVKDNEFDIGACLDENRPCHISAVDISTVTGLNSAPFDCDLHSPRKDKKKKKKKRKLKTDAAENSDNYNMIPEYSDNGDVGACLAEIKPLHASAVDISTEPESKNSPCGSELRSPRKNKKKSKKKQRHNAAETNDKNDALLEHNDNAKVDAYLVETEPCHASAVDIDTEPELKISPFGFEQFSPRKNKEKRKRKHGAAGDIGKENEATEYNDNNEVGGSLLQTKACHNFVVDSDTETNLKSPSFCSELSSPRKNKEERKRKNRHNELPKYNSVVSMGSTEVDVSLHDELPKPTSCSMNELETSQIGACLAETECHTSAVDIRTEIELKSASFDSHRPLFSNNKEKKHKHIGTETKDKADELLHHNDSSDVGACLFEKNSCHASEVDVNTDTELKSTPLGSELSSPLKTRKKKKRKCNAAANNDNDTQKANDYEINFPEFSSFVDKTSTEAELLVNICSINASTSKLYDSETETRRKSSEKEIQKSVQEVAESFIEDIKECRDDKNEVGTLLMGKRKSIGGREKRKTKSERKCLRGGLVGDSVVEVAFRPSTNDLGGEYMTEQSKQMNKVKNLDVTICENDSIKDVGTKTMIEEVVPPMFLSSLDGAYTGSSKKKLLVLDVNGLLADIVPSSRFIRGDLIISRKAVFKRPYCDDFLQFCFQNFNVGVWSSRTKENLGKAINFLIGDSKHKLLFCWDQSHCTVTGFKTLENKEKPLLLKELKKLWENDTLPWGKGEYDESNTLLLDDSPYKALRNPAHTAIFPYPYRFRDAKTDSSLGPNGDLRMYLQTIATAENVQKHVEQNHFGQARITETDPSWRFYSKIIRFNS